MVDLIKMVYTLMFPPGCIILAIIGYAVWLGYRRKGWRRILPIGGAALLLYTACIPYVGKSLLYSLENDYSVRSVTGDVVIMLGGGATLGTRDVDVQGHLSGGPAVRLLTALKLHNKLGVPIIVSGGQVFSDTGNESQIARLNLLAAGVKDPEIFVDDRSRTTKENAKYVKKIIEEQGFQRPILVTSAFHMDRAVHLFNKAGIDVEPYPTNFTVGKPKLYLDNLIPSSAGLSATTTALKEYLGKLQ